ncbi:MAG TPA: phosphodiesterase [Gammaproteobacteria bacterium]|nr:phosphodiesterase [Gammaproteobacteria bacterium]
MSEKQYPVEDNQFYLELLRAYFNSTQEAIFVLCDEMKFLTCNRTTEDWLGRSEQELTAHNRRTPITRLLGKDYNAEKFRTFFRNSIQGESVSFETRINPENGKDRWIDINLSRVDIEGGDMVIAVARDISERKRHLATIQYQSSFDELTGLPNRSAFLTYLEKYQKDENSLNQQLVLFVLDIDRFKEINKSMGHQNGDIILQEVSQRLSRVTDVASGEFLARLGGDDFVIAFPDIALSQSRITAQMIRQILSRPILLDDGKISLSCAIGIAGVPEHTDDCNQLLQLAESAMYTAKTERLGIEIYNPETAGSSRERLQLITDLREALADNLIVPYYQPIRNMQTGAIHVEVLARWNDEKRGAISPEKFIALAEETGNINRLTSKILRTSLQECSQALNKQMIESLSLNISPYCLSNMKLPGEIQGYLDEFNIPANMITLEITESVIMSSLPKTRETINSLEALGLTFSIDDFGTGYSSLSKLKLMPLKELKIDKSFITEINHNDNDAAITNAAIQMAHGLGLNVVAEGIESEPIWNRLQQMGCDYGQGFWIARPMPIEALLDWLREHPVNGFN